MYKEYYLMQDEPFAPFPSPLLYYKSKNHHKAWKNLIHTIKNKEPIVMVAGEYGTGKTLICLKMLRFMEKYNIQPRIHIPSPGYDFSMVLEKIARELGIAVDPGNTAECRRSIYEYFETEVPEKNQYLYIIIDDIHEFDYTFISELTKLITYNYNGYFPIKLFMFGHTGFLQNLDKRSLISFKQRIRVVTLSPLKMAEVTEYIYFRLIASGASGSPVFSEDAVALITEMSQGLPRLINKICDNSLLLAYKKRVNVIDRTIVTVALAENGILDFDAHIEPVAPSRLKDNKVPGKQEAGIRRPGTRVIRQPARETILEQEVAKDTMHDRRSGDLFSEPAPKKHSAERKKTPAMDVKKTGVIDGKTLTIAGLIIIVVLMALFFIRELRMNPMPAPEDLMNNKTGSVISNPIQNSASNEKKYHVVTKGISRPEPAGKHKDGSGHHRLQPVVEEFSEVKTDNDPLSGTEKNEQFFYEAYVTESYNQKG